MRKWLTRLLRANDNYGELHDTHKTKGNIIIMKTSCDSSILLLLDTDGDGYHSSHFGIWQSFIMCLPQSPTIFIASCKREKHK